MNKSIAFISIIWFLSLFVFGYNIYKGIVDTSDPKSLGSIIQETQVFDQ